MSDPAPTPPTCCNEPMMQVVYIEIEPPTGDRYRRWVCKACGTMSYPEPVDD